MILATLYYYYYSPDLPPQVEVVQPLVIIRTIRGIILLHRSTSGTCQHPRAPPLLAIKLLLFLIYTNESCAESNSTSTSTSSTSGKSNKT